MEKGLYVIKINGIEMPNPANDPEGAHLIHRQIFLTVAEAAMRHHFDNITTSWNIPRDGINLTAAYNGNGAIREALAQSLQDDITERFPPEADPIEVTISKQG